MSRRIRESIVPGIFHTSIKFEGEEALLKKLTELEGFLDRKDVLQAVKGGADIIRSKALSNLKSRTKVKTGNLRRSLVSKTYREQRRGNPAAFAAIDYRIGRHAHLLEFGHWMIVEPKSQRSKEGYTFKKGGVLSRKRPWVGARPFFRPAVGCSIGPIRELWTRKLTDILAKAAKP